MKGGGGGEGRGREGRGRGRGRRDEVKGGGGGEEDQEGGKERDRLWRKGRDSLHLEELHPPERPQLMIIVLWSLILNTPTQTNVNHLKMGCLSK